jgi:hypothetical protein
VSPDAHPCRAGHVMHSFVVLRRLQRWSVVFCVSHTRHTVQFVSTDGSMFISDHMALPDDVAVCDDMALPDDRAV